MEQIIVVGLCNPGKEFNMTYHNIGKALIDKIVEQHGESMQSQSGFMSCKINDVIFAYSNNVYMNHSSQVILQLKQRYGLLNHQLVVLHDEVMLELGKVKCSYGGSAKGHNGLRDIIQKIGDDFFRVKIGVGHPGKGLDLGKYLTKPTKPALWNVCLNNAIEQITCDVLLKIPTSLKKVK